MKNLVSIFITLFFTVTAFSQKSKPPTLLTDSIAVWELRKVAHPLGLDSNQAKYFVGATKNHLDELNKIKNSNLNDSLRILSVRESDKKYSNVLSTILSKEQFQKFTMLQENSKHRFTENQNKRKNQVKSLQPQTKDSL